jgi:hypothetical protein
MLHLVNSQLRMSVNQLTDNDIVDLVSHAGDDDLEDDNEGPEKADSES